MAVLSLSAARSAGPPLSTQKEDTMKPAKMLGVATNDGRMPATPPTLTFMAMHTDAIGQSALAFDELAGFTSGSLGGGSAAL